MRRFRHPKDIHVGVVGYGDQFNMGRAYLEEMQQAGMTPVAVAEIDSSRLDTARKEFPGIETYSSLARMLKGSQVDLVTIITPHNTHARLALQALRAGKHVVCEKPLAITTAQCDAMIAAARTNKVIVSAYHNRHWDGCIREAVRTIKTAAIGDIVRIEAHMGRWEPPQDWWRSSKSISGGICYDWGVHLLEYSLQLIDSEIVEVSGFAKSGFWAPRTAWKDDTIEDEGVPRSPFRRWAVGDALHHADRFPSQRRRPGDHGDQGFVPVQPENMGVGPAEGREGGGDQGSQSAKRVVAILSEHRRASRKPKETNHHGRMGPPPHLYTRPGKPQRRKRQGH